MKQRFAIMAILTIFGIAGTASASVLGSLNVANCGNTGDGVTVSLTAIDWTNPIGGGFGCIVAGTGTSLTFTSVPAGSSPFIGGPGTIEDLPATSANLAKFMEFITPGGTLDFALTLFGPGSSQDCATAGLFVNCSVNGNTPIILQKTGDH